MIKKCAYIKDIAVHLPSRVLNNDHLAELYPEWSAEKILEKTGISERRIAGENETSGDLAFAAAKKLFNQGVVAASDIDFTILCTQSPDYILPTTACILQDKLGISRNSGAIDINLGCSGFVYGLSLAKGLIETGAARCVLLLTADTYSKYIHPMDKSVRTLFGDAAAATAVVGKDSEQECIGPFVFGTDGSGAKNLIVEAGLYRMPKSDETSIDREDGSGNIRSLENLYMNGADVMAFSLREVPKALDLLLLKANQSKEDVDFFVLHQANKFMLEALRKKLKISEQKLPILVENCGNTVSSTIPMALYSLIQEGRLKRNQRLVLLGFGVGYSWAGCLLNF
jgi:3-oxoacyl-[acyl-carrier-protein] synthase III